MVELQAGVSANVHCRPILILDPQETIFAGVDKIVGHQTDPIHWFELGQCANDDHLALDDRGNGARFSCQGPRELPKQRNNDYRPEHGSLPQTGRFRERLSRSVHCRSPVYTQSERQSGHLDSAIPNSVGIFAQNAAFSSPKRRRPANDAQGSRHLPFPSEQAGPAGLRVICRRARALPAIDRAKFIVDRRNARRISASRRSSRRRPARSSLSENLRLGIAAKATLSVLDLRERNPGHVLRRHAWGVAFMVRA
jgi:hypothetical protein